jgi:hypothetical protein
MSGFARGGLPNFPTRLEQYQPAVVDSVRRKDGKKLAELLSLRRISRGLGHYLARVSGRIMIRDWGNIILGVRDLCIVTSSPCA